MDKPILALNNLDVGRNGHAMLHIDELEVHAGEIVALLGPSGCGKTTTLMTVAGSLNPIRGEIVIDGEPRDREWRAEQTAITHQNFPLFHWLTVRENLRMACRVRGAPSTGLDEILDDFSALALADRFPVGLSGGERCRASLAQAVVARPRLMLLDEPFTGLDTLVKEDVAGSLFEFARRSKVGVVLVTHDLHDAVAFTSRAVVLSPRPGRIVARVATSNPEAVKLVHAALSNGVYQA